MAVAARPRRWLNARALTCGRGGWLQGVANDWLEASELRNNPCLALWRRCRPAWWLEQHPACKLQRYMPPPTPRAQQQQQA